MSNLLTVSDVARALSEELGVDVGPRDLSDLFYKRLLRNDLCPVVGGRRLIPSGYVAEILTILRARGVVPVAGGGGVIDPLDEDLICPSLATRLFPPGPNGKYVHDSFVYRAMKTGCRSIILESTRTPKLATSRQAVARFIRRMTKPTRRRVR